MHKGKVFRDGASLLRLALGPANNDLWHFKPLGDEAVAVRVSGVGGLDEADTPKPETCHWA